MRALLAVAAKDHHRGIVLLAEELQAAGVLEGVDDVLLAELDAERALERVQVGHDQVEDLRGRRVLEEEGGARVLVQLRRLVVQEALGARILGLDLAERLLHHFGGILYWGYVGVRKKCFSGVVPRP